MDVMHNVLASYGFDKNKYTIEQFGSGLINDTCVVTNGKEKYILQKVNNKVFTNPLLIADNIEKIENYLSKNKSDYFFTAPCYTSDGKSMLKIDESYYRMFPFVKNSHSIDVVQTSEQAFEAAKQFGKFTKVLSGIDVSTLNITLPAFHDLAYRYQQFLESLEKGNKERQKEVANLIDQLKGYVDIVETFNEIQTNPEFKLRVTHHDTKISNVLFNEHNKGVCVIDLDTVMPGYFISDVGDMMRTYLCPVSEEEQDFSKIIIREDFYQAIISGYKTYMADELTETEQQYFFYSGKFMIYMQALRFLTDYINDDIYYGAKYQHHNLVRATNQVTLLSKLLEKESTLSGFQ